MNIPLLRSVQLGTPLKSVNGFALRRSRGKPAFWLMYLLRAHPLTILTDHTMSCEMMLPENQMTGWAGEEKAPLRLRRTEAAVAEADAECGTGTGDLRGATGDDDVGHEGDGMGECFLCGEVGCDCESDVWGIGTPGGGEETEWGIGPPGGGWKETGGCGTSWGGESDGMGYRTPWGG